MTKFTTLKKTRKDIFTTTLSCNRFDIFKFICSYATLIKKWREE